MSAMWQIVGGTSTGGILVREGHDTKSTQLDDRLSTGAQIEELELIGTRLKYKLISGAGPSTGWISIELKEKQLAVRLDHHGPSGENAKSIGAVSGSAADIPTGTAAWRKDQPEGLPRQLLRGERDCRLSNGAMMPILGLGMWKLAPAQTKEVALRAMELGYRHFDTARLYGNEKELGDALKEAQSKGTVKREEVFITTKLWSTHHGAKKVPLGLHASMRGLDCGYVDLFLLHLPDIAAQSGYPGDIPPLEDTWKGMEKLIDDGKCKSIGVANFSKKQLERLLACARIPPVVNQIELHPYLPQQDLVDFCKDKGVAVVAYSPLGSADSRNLMSYTHSGHTLLQDGVVLDVATAIGKTPAQVLLRWAVQRGTVVIPKTATIERLAENFDVFDWELPLTHFNALNDIKQRMRLLSMADCCGEKLPAKTPLDIFDDPEGLTSQ